jgi:hypothetical protein
VSTINPITFLIGVAALLFGIYSLYIRINNPAKFGKLAAMKERWGENLGGAIHFVSYTLAPVCVGVALILAGLRGVKIF